MKSLLLAAALVLAGLGSAKAQAYPSRPIMMIVPYPPGGVTDDLARIVVERMTISLGQPMIVENITGANGVIGVGRAARAAPDGYTVCLGQLTSHVFNGAVYTLPYDLLKDFEPVSLLTRSPLWIVARSAFPAKDLKELITWLKANPDKAAVAIPGVGSPAHVAGVYFQKTTGTRFQFVPYRGGAPALQDLMAGHVDLMFLEASQSLAYVRSGSIKPYAVMSKTRWAAAPEVPTTDELGVPGVDIPFWHGLWVPRGTSKEVIAKLNAAVVDSLAEPAVRQRLADMGQDIFPREQQTPEALGAYQKAEIAKWWPIIKAANIKLE